MEINIKLKVDENTVKAIEEKISRGRKVVIRIRDLNIDLAVGPDTSEETIYTLKIG